MAIRKAAKASLSDAVASALPVLMAGLFYAFVVGGVGAICALTQNTLLLILGSFLTTGIAFGSAMLNAGAPNFARLQIVIIAMPFIAATAFLDVPYRFVVALQLPLWCACLAMMVERSHKTAAALLHAQRRISHLAFNDALTGLPNRTRIIDLLESSKTRSGSGRTTDFVLYLDLDGFKAVNDRFGHFVGDQLLQAVAARFRGSIRSSDSIGRLGGDEFVVILRDVDVTQAEAAAGRLIEAATEPFDLEGAPDIRIGASIGAARMTGVDPHRSMRAADDMLYAAKRAGRGRYQIADDGTTEVCGAAA